ncbi:MAG: hypothetical protein U0805_11325 [Pirellulales bacterium]
MAFRLPRAVLCALCAMVALSAENTASGIGYFNMPGNSWQWCGHGFAGGYHAPFVLGPVTGECTPGVNLHRQAYAPNPYACAPCYAGGGCERNEGSLQEPTALLPNSAPSAVPSQSSSERLMAPRATTPQRELLPRSSLLMRPVKY